jgi:C-terminal processing protease CtpA/Prc
VRESARDTARESRDEAQEAIRDTREQTRDRLRNARGDARDMARQSRRDYRDTVSDLRDSAQDMRRDYREDLQDTRRDARDWARQTTRDMRNERPWRGEVRDELRDFARDVGRDAARYGESQARDALDTARYNRQQDADGRRDWDRFGRDAASDWDEFNRGVARDARDATRDDRSFDDRYSGRDVYAGDRQYLDRDADRYDAGDRDFARDNRDAYRDQRDQDRRSFAQDIDRRGDDSRYRDQRYLSGDRQDSRRSRITRSQIDNFRAASISTADLGLDLNRTSRGLVVNDIRSGAIASRIGLRANDQIIAVQNYRVNNPDQFVRYLFHDNWRYNRVTVWVLRNGREVPVYVQPVQLIEQLILVNNGYAPAGALGVVFDDRYDDELVVQTVARSSTAYRAGLRPGDVIVRVYGQRVTRPWQFTQVLAGVDSSQVPLVIERDRSLREIVVDVPETLQTTSQRRTSYRRDFDDSAVRGYGQSTTRTQSAAPTQYDGTVYQQSYAAPGGIYVQPGQVSAPDQYQPAQPVQPSNRMDNRENRPGILPRLFGR